MERPILEPWEWKLILDPVTNRNHLWFGPQLYAEAKGQGGRLSWECRLFDRPFKASAAVLGLGIAAKTQRDLYGGLIPDDFNITASALEIIQVEDLRDQIDEAVKLELGWQRLARELARAKYQP
jgi:hypothetical protein